MSSTRANFNIVFALHKDTERHDKHEMILSTKGAGGYVVLHPTVFLTPKSSSWSNFTLPKVHPQKFILQKFILGPPKSSSLKVHPKPYPPKSSSLKVHPSKVHPWALSKKFILAWALAELWKGKATNSWSPCITCNGNPFGHPKTHSR